MPAQSVTTRRNALRFWLLILAAWLVPALLSAFSTYMQDRLDGQKPNWRWVVFNGLDWLFYAVLTPLVFRAARRFPLQHPRLARRIAIHIAGALALCVAWAALGTLLRLVIFPRAADLTAIKVWLGFVSWIFTTFPFGVGVYFALVGIQHSFFYFAQARERETQAALLSAQLSEARLGALRMQLNPHFLFNSLNVPIFRMIGHPGRQFLITVSCPCQASPHARSSQIVRSRAESFAPRGDLHQPNHGGRNQVFRPRIFVLSSDSDFCLPHPKGMPRAPPSFATL